MSNANEEFEIPFELSRKGRELEQETKAVGRRLASYIGSRLVDRPNIGGGRKRRRGDIDVPTGGIPGSRKPTGSDFDPDNDGWVDEGTTRPRFVGERSAPEVVRSSPRLSSGASEQRQQSSSPNSLSIARQRVDGLRAAIAEYEKTGNWTGADNGVILRANNDQFFSSIDIDSRAIKAPANQTREQFVASLNEELDKRNVTDPAKREKEINDAIKSRLEEAKEKLILAELSLKIQEWEESRKNERLSQNVLDVEDMPEETRNILREEAKLIRAMSEDESEKLFISPSTSNAYFIHHGMAELDGGALDPDRSRGQGLGSSQVVGNTRMLNEMMANNKRQEHSGHKKSLTAFRGLLEKLRNDDANSVISSTDEIYAMAAVMSSPYPAFADYPRVTGGWEIGDSIRSSDLKARRPDISMDGVIAGVELNISVHANKEEELRTILARLDGAKNFMSTHGGMKKAASNWQGYLNRYQTDSYRAIAQEVEKEKLYRLGNILDSQHSRGTSWFGVGRWGVDITSELGPGEEWQVIGKNTPIFGLSKPNGFDATEYSDILLAITPRVMRMHDERGAVDIDELIAEINSGSKPVQRLSSGGSEKPSYPRKPTYGAFIGGAEDEFGSITSWAEFRDKYNDREIIFFDYETTGLVFDEFRKPSSNGRPTQFGAVKMKNGEIIDSINIFMNPEEPLGEWSLANLKDIDGNPLTDEWLKTQTSIKKAHEQLAEFAGDDAIFGVQNASFDKDVLELALGESGIQWRPKGYIDTKEIADMALPRWTPETDDGPFILDKDGNKRPSNGLAAITKYLNVDLGEKHHTADADAEATGLVMSAIINGAVENNWSSDVLSADKRQAKMNANNAKFAAAVEKFEQDVAEYRRLMSGGEDDYRGMHMAPDAESGAPLHNLAGVYPDDVYSAASIRYYGTGNDELDAAAVSFIKRFRDKPDADVTVYRAVPISRDEQINRLEKQKQYILRYGKIPRGISTNLTHSEYYDEISSELDILRNQEESELVSINPGDWVTPVRQYAIEHGEGVLRGDYEIVKKKVKAKDIYTNGDSWLEWGYDPSGDRRLSSGAEYESVVEKENTLSQEQLDSIELIKAVRQNDELNKSDVREEVSEPGFEGTVYSYSTVIDSDDRKAVKDSLRGAANRAFSTEIETRQDVVVTALNGEQINLGNKFDVVATTNSVQIDELESDEIEQWKEVIPDSNLSRDDGKPATAISMSFNVIPKNEDARKKLLAAGIPKSTRWDSLGDVEEFEIISNANNEFSIATATRTLAIKGDETLVMHDGLQVSRSARGNGIASLINARNEAVYRALGAETIITQAQSGADGDYMGVTHWARNGFTWASDSEKQKFIKVIDDAIKDSSESWFSSEERQRIGSMYSKAGRDGFKTNASIEELVDFERSDELFRKGDGTSFFLKRNVRRRSQSSAPRTIVNRLLGRGSRREQREGSRLSSGKERPLIKVNTPNIKKHQSAKYKYGDSSELGGKVRRTRSDWMRNMTSEQMSNLIVPTSMDEFLEMAIDDYAPGGRESKEYRSKFNNVYAQYFKNNPWDEPDFSPETVAAVREMVKQALDSNPKLKWAFETHGAPMFFVQTEAASRAYEAIPDVKVRLDQIAAIRSASQNDKKPFVRARTSPFLTSVSFNRRLIIDRETNNSEKQVEDIVMDQFRRVTSRDNGIDTSITGVIAHEWGHWLHFRALKDRELAGKPRNRHYYGSGDPGDARYAKALEVAQYYADTSVNSSMLDRFNQRVDINSVKDEPMTLSSYGNTNRAESFAEGVVAMLHPNDDVKMHALNRKLRNDVASILFIDDNQEPWGKIPNTSPSSQAITPERLSSGAASTKQRVKYSPEQIRKIASQVEVKYAETPEKRQLARKTLQKGFQGGFTVELDTMDDIKNGVAVARNKKGMIFPAASDFTPDGEPTEELIDTFVAWLDFHGPDVFNNPSEGAERVAIGGWVDNGTLYLDVTDIYPASKYLPLARELGGQENQKAVTHLDMLWELLESGADDLSPAFIDTGGDGGQTITRETIEKFRKALLAFESGDEGQPKLPVRRTKKKS